MGSGGVVRDVKNTDEKDKWDVHRIAPIVEEQNYIYIDED
jgi:hypothetical protein